MLNLPKTTELSRQLPKKAIFEKFDLDRKAKDRIDADIAKIMIVNELSADRIQIAAGEEVKSIYVLHVTLKRKDYNTKSIEQISRLIPQNILFVLEWEGDARLAIYQTRLVETNWAPLDSWHIELNGSNLDIVWRNLVRMISGGTWDEALTIHENLERNREIERLQREIARLEKAAYTEKQPHRKFEMVQEVQKLRKRLEELK